VQAGGQGALGGEVVFQVQDAPRGGQGVPLVEQLADPGGEGELAAGVAAAPAGVRSGLTAPAASSERRNACRTPRTSAARPVV
jgi:hypothetical protein